MNLTPLIIVSATRCLVAMLALALCMSVAAGQGEVYRCATTDEVYQALKAVKAGDTILLEGGRVYEIAESFMLKADGTENARITFSSEDVEGQGRYAVITTVDGRKEDDLVAFSVRGSFWNISRLEIAGKKVPLEPGYWDTNGFRIGLYLMGPGSHHNVIEGIHIHHTHNTAVAIRDRAHHNIFRRMHIHDIGEWLSADYNAHEGEGFYIGSSKGYDEREYNAIAHDILIEDSVIGPGLLGQYLDFKYAASRIIARNNVLHCGEKSYNEEIVKLAGYANFIEGNKFVGSADNLKHYIHAFNKKTKVPVTVDYLGQQDIPAPTGRDNKVINNVFYTDNTEIPVIKNDLNAKDRSTLLVEGNRIEPLENYSERKP